HRRFQDGDARPGRTDAGVHATAQVAHVDLVKAWPSDKVRDAVNAHLQAAGGAQPDRFAAEFFDRLFDRLLHRRLIRLVLPAGKQAAVIFDVEAKTRHLRLELSPRAIPGKV
ncbi:hypothetical protein EN958_21000, partial [Mesorhizobium sp. M7A.F.Ca.CA.002.15.1.1]